MWLVGNGSHLLPKYLRQLVICLLFLFFFSPLFLTGQMLVFHCHFVVLFPLEVHEQLVIDFWSEVRTILKFSWSNWFLMALYYFFLFLFLNSKSFLFFISIGTQTQNLPDPTQIPCRFSQASRILALYLYHSLLLLLLLLFPIYVHVMLSTRNPSLYFYISTYTFMIATNCILYPWVQKTFNIMPHRYLSCSIFYLDLTYFVVFFYATLF